MSVLIETIREPIQVMSIFEGGVISPVRFKWAGRIHAVREVTYRWRSRNGTSMIHHFAIINDAGDQFEFYLDSGSMEWTLTKVAMAG